MCDVRCAVLSSVCDVRCWVRCAFSTALRTPHVARVYLPPAAGGVVGAVIGADGVRVAEADLAGVIVSERHHDIDTSDPSHALDAIAPLIAGAIHQVFTDGSVTSMFDGAA